MQNRGWKVNALWAGAGCAAAAMATASFAHDPAFVVASEMGMPLGVVGHRAYGINNHGTVVGAAVALDGLDYPYMWNDATDMVVMLDTPGIINGVNDKHLFVGWVERDGEPNAISCQDHQYTWLDMLPGGTCSAANAVNEGGVIVGWSYNDLQQKRATVWVDGQVSELPTLGGTCAEAVDVNESGVIVGWAYDANETKRAAMWVDGVVTDLGTLGGTTAQASAINDLGEISGCAETANGRYHAFGYRDGVMRQLLNLNGPESMATAMNNDHIVGWSMLPLGEEPSAVMWERGGIMNLNAMLEPGSIWDLLTCATAINDRQQVAGYGTLPDGSVQSFIMTPNLVISALEPCLAGVDNSITVSGATPDANVYFVYGSDYGDTELPSCPGVMLGIANAKVAGVAVADESGNATLETFIPLAAEGRVVLMQTLEPSSCRASDTTAYLF